MLTKKTIALLLTGLASINVTYAATDHRMIVAPHCLIKQIETPHKTLASQNKYSLIEINQNGIDELSVKKNFQCGGFIDVTDTWEEKNIEKSRAKDFLKGFIKSFNQPISPTAYSIKYPTQVNQMLVRLNSQRMWNRLTIFSSFPDRYSRTDNGVAAANWIRNQVQMIASGRTDVSIYFVPTGTYKQPSVVAKFGTSNEPGIVIGGHMDTTSGVKPGADDDGTGSVTVLEAADILIKSGLRFKKPIYFVWYAAEEVGLVGSQYVVKDFKAKNIPVSEVMQLDMTGYPDRNNPTAIWLMDDYVNPTLSAYIATLINTYVKKPVMHDRCGYACSDHATWTRNGYAAVMPFEASMRTYNPYIHTSQDTMEKLVLAHMNDYAKLALAFAVELAEPVA